jgi:hypothetical protein
VGIGTKTPDVKLTVESPESAVIKVTTDSAQNYSGVYINNSSPGGSELVLISLGPTYPGDYAPGVKSANLGVVNNLFGALLLKSADSTVFYNGANRAMRISPTGGVFVSPLNHPNTARFEVEEPGLNTPAAKIYQTSPTNTKNALTVQTKGTGTAIQGINNGVGGVGVHGWIQNGTAASKAVFAENYGLGTAVEASAYFGPAVKASLSGFSVDKDALEIDNGYIKVSGASRTAFVHTTTIGNTTDHRTMLNYTPMEPTDMIIVTHQYVTSHLPRVPVGVWWNVDHWEIFLDRGFGTETMPIGEKFNVLVIKQ